MGPTGNCRGTLPREWAAHNRSRERRSRAQPGRVWHLATLRSHASPDDRQRDTRHDAKAKAQQGIPDCADSFPDTRGTRKHWQQERYEAACGQRGAGKGPATPVSRAQTAASTGEKSHMGPAACHAWIGRQRQTQKASIAWQTVAPAEGKSHVSSGTCRTWIRRKRQTHENAGIPSDIISYICNVATCFL